MSTPAVPTPIEEQIPGEVVPTPAPVVEPAAPVQQRYEWQPTDENDKPIGGRQVILYTTPEDKFEKMQERSVQLLRQLRKVTRDAQLGTPESIPDDAERFENVTEFVSRDLTAEERFDIAQKITNPETFIDGRDRLIESAFGKKPAEVAQTLNDMQKSLIQSRAVENYVEFVNAARFPDSPENRSSITRWLTKRNLSPTIANFNLAFSKLTESGLIQETPVVRQEPVPVAPVMEPVVPVESVVNPQPPAVPAPRIEGEVQPQAKRHSHVPSSLNDRVSSATGVPTPVVGSSLTLADIDRMPADEYKAKLKDPAFVKHLNELEAARTKRLQARANG